MKVEQSLGGAKRSKWRFWIPTIAAATAALVVLILAGFWMRYSRGEQAVGELADLHVATLASVNPVDVVSTDRHTVKPWFQGKLPFSFNLPDLQDSQFKLLGGKLTYFQQNAGAQLIFADERHEISVFIFQKSAELGGLNSGIYLRNRLALDSETWTEGGLWYFAVGDANATDIRALSELLKKAARS